MKPEEIKLSDWARIMFGDVPPEFYLELIIRAFLVYLLLMVSMRFLGKRMSNQMSGLELAAMVALASSIGVPMLAADRGILPAYVIAIVIIGITRLVAWYSSKNEKFEQVSQGDTDLLVKDSVMNFDTMQKVRVTRERLLAEVRSGNINHLGRIKRLYMEPNGTFSVVENEQPQPGLSALPEWDQEFISRKVYSTSTKICKNCGAQMHAGFSNGSESKCNNCGKSKWTQAVRDV